MRFGRALAMLACMLLCFSGCQAASAPGAGSTQAGAQTNAQQKAVGEQMNGEYTADSLISDVIRDPAFEGYGHLLFPVDAGYYSGDTLGELQLTWYHNIDPEKTVEIVNYLKSRAQAGETVFYDIYTQQEKQADPEKENTGLFFFKGTPGEKFAVCNAGGGFAYVGAMQDSFPHALELSKRAIMPLRLSTAQAPRRPVKTWRGPSALFSSTHKSCRQTRTVIPFGAALRAGAWLHGWALMARRRSAEVTCRAPAR